MVSQDEIAYLLRWACKSLSEASDWPLGNQGPVLGEGEWPLIFSAESTRPVLSLERVCFRHSPVVVCGRQGVPTPAEMRKAWSVEGSQAPDGDAEAEFQGRQGSRRPAKTIKKLENGQRGLARALRSGGRRAGRDPHSCVLCRDREKGASASSGTMWFSTELQLKFR